MESCNDTVKLGTGWCQSVVRSQRALEHGMGEEARGILEHGRERHVVEETKEWEVMESL